MRYIREKNLLFVFNFGVSGTKYDAWRHSVREQGKKVDFVATQLEEQPREAWLIEVGDFRNVQTRPKIARPAGINPTENLVEETMTKFQDTLRGLENAQKHAESWEKLHAILVCRAGIRRLALHLEFGAPGNKLFPLIPNPRDVFNLLKQKIANLSKQGQFQFAIHPAPLVLSMTTTPDHCPWRVSTLTETNNERVNKNG